MSASILYQVIKPKNLPISLPSSFIKGLENAFGSLPIKLNKDNIERLEGMAALYEDYKLLIQILNQCEEIEVWAEY